MRIREILVTGLFAFTVLLAQPMSSSLPVGLTGLIGTSEAQAWTPYPPRLGGGGGGDGGGGGGGPSSAPEISGAAGLSVLALLACCIMVMRGRR